MNPAITIQNVALTGVGTRNTFLVPLHVEEIIIQGRSADNIRIYLGAATVPYFTIKNGAPFTWNDQLLSGQTLYLEAAVGANTAEIIIRQLPQMA